MRLANKGKYVPFIFYHNPLIKNNQGYTVALLQAKNGKIPDRKWRHNKFIRVKTYISNIDDYQYFTVKNFLDQAKVKVPQYWDYESDEPQSIIDAWNGNIPEFKQDSDPLQSNLQNQTVAILLSSQGTIPPMQWMHDIDMEDDERNSIRKNLLKYQLPIPLNYIQKKLNIFDKAIFKQIPDITNHKSDQQDNYGFTIAMILLINNIKIPKQWYHDPSIQNIYDNTMAMYYANKSIIPPDQWNHNPEIQNKNKYTVAMILIDKQLIPPQQWMHKPELQDRYGFTVAMKFACLKQIPPIYWNHNPNIQDNKNKMTVAMYLAYNNILPPIQWYHDPLIKDEKHWTTAMFIAQYCHQIPSRPWYHSPTISTLQHNTVALFLAGQKIIPSIQWLHDINYQNDDKQSIKNLLKSQIQVFYQNKLILNVKLKFLDETCQICFNSGKQIFVDSICGHSVCFDCLCHCLIDDSGNENEDFDEFVDVVDKRLLWNYNDVCYGECSCENKYYLIGIIKSNKQQKIEIMKIKCPYCRMNNWYHVLTDQILEDYQQMIQNYKRQ